MKRRWKILIIVGVAGAVAILIPIIRHYQLRHAVESYIAGLKARGEPMELAQVLPPTVPLEQNSAETLCEADALFDASFGAEKSLLETNYVSGMKMTSPGKAMIRWQQPDIRDVERTNSWENVTAAVAGNAKAFELLQQIIQKPAFDFKIEYDRGVADLNFTNFHLVESKRAVQRLEAATLCELHQGDTISAVENLRAMLALVKAMRDERLEICELVRIAMASFALNANWELLQSPNLTDEQLAALQRDWMNLDFIRGSENALAMERVTGKISLTKWRNSNSELYRYFALGKAAAEVLGEGEVDDTVFGKAKTKAKVFLWRNWWSYSDELRCLKGYEALMDAMRLAATNGSFQDAFSSQGAALEQLGISKLVGSFDSLFTGKINFHSMLSESIVTLAGAARKVMRAEAAKQVVATAIALRRFQLKHGKYPVALEALMPEFISTVPIDPVDGQLLRYRLNTDGTFLLYSVGENGVDDGGDPSLQEHANSSNFYWQNQRAFDWVWPQPATPEEVENYYTHPPK